MSGRKQSVWYVAYGSNINRERFMKYIQNCSDTTAPVQSKPITIAHNIYFAGKSATWKRKGTAFLDDTCPGMSLGRMYLITSAQFAQIQKQEGLKYSKKVLLGMEEDLPVYTFTAQSKRSDKKAPCEEYFHIILKGLKETYPDYSETALKAYLMDSDVLEDDDCKILSFIRNSEHGVSLQKISENTVAVSRVKKSIKKLMELKLLKQDGRSIRAGYSITDYEAVFYTNKEYREVILLLLLMNR